MSDKYHYSHEEVFYQVTRIAELIIEKHKGLEYIYLCPVPRGGVPVVYMLIALLNKHFINVKITEHPKTATIIVDDIIDSGRTRDKYRAEAPQADFFALVDKPALRESKRKLAGQWVVFPWENPDPRSDMEDTVTRLLEQIGENPTREGLRETPKRVANAYDKWFEGYNYDDDAVGRMLKVFKDGGDNYDEMVTVKRIPFYSMCEHHMAPFFGVVTIGYIPNGKIVGLSKLSRITKIFARRLQVQERLTTQIAEALMKHLDAKGVGVIVEARHLCMESRGVCEQGHSTITTALRGVMSEPAVRQEFLSYHKP